MSALNPRVIQELRALEAGSPNFLTELIDLFVKESGPRVAGLEKALKERDARTLERLAHTLKGSSGNLGAEALSRLCNDLQNSARGQDWGASEALIPRAVAAYAEVEKELLDLRNRKPS